MKKKIDYNLLKKKMQMEQSNNCITHKLFSLFSFVVTLVTFRDGQPLHDFSDVLVCADSGGDRPLPLPPLLCHPICVQSSHTDWPLLPRIHVPREWKMSTLISVSLWVISSGMSVKTDYNETTLWFNDTYVQFLIDLSSVLTTFMSNICWMTMITIRSRRSVAFSVCLYHVLLLFFTPLLWC